MEKQLKEIIRSVIREQFISELSKNDVHVKEIMKFYDKGSYSTKKAVSIFVAGKPNATRNQILDELGDLGYDEIWDVMDHFKLKLEGVNEIAVQTDEIPGGLASGKTMKDFVKKYNSNEYYDNNQMAEKIKEKIQQGVKVEMEHTTDPKVAFEIAKDHVWEDLNYYDKLAKVEEYVDDKGVEHVAAALPQTEEEPIKEALIKGKTYGGSKCEGGCFIGKNGLMKIIKISKESPKDVFMFRDDNYSGLQPHFIKNGVIAKATVINPAYDLEKHKVKNLKIGNDVILSVRLFVSTNESVNESNECGCN